MIDAIWISCPSAIHNNFGLQFMCSDRRWVREFKSLGWELLCGKNTPFVAFLQGGGNSPNSDWAYYEIWNWYEAGVQDELFELALELAEHYGLELEIRNF
jgi:hypothetical protein